MFCFFTTATQARIIDGIDEQYAEAVRVWNTRVLNEASMARGYTRRRGGEDYNMGRAGHGVYRGHGYGGSSRTRYSHGYGSTRRRWTPGYDRTGGYYGRFAGSKGELKFFDREINESPTQQAGTVTNSINLVAQGTTEVTRNGRKMTIKSINWRYTLFLPEQDAQGTPTSSDTVRIVMYVDKQANGATAAVTDILETAGVHSFRNLANTNRFVVLCDKQHTLNYRGMASDGAGLVSQGMVINHYTYYKKVDIPIEFNATAGAMTEVMSNNIGVLILSYSGVASIDSKVRIRFSDASSRC